VIGRKPVASPDETVRAQFAELVAAVPKWADNAAGLAHTPGLSYGMRLRLEKVARAMTDAAQALTAL
jgi:hypothetical protein